MTRRMRRAVVYGIDATMAECVREAKGNHSGWRNQTGTAEGSIKIVDPAESSKTPGSVAAVGIWGSVGVRYMIYLEYLHGSALRRAADVKYKNLQKHIRTFFARGRG